MINFQQTPWHLRLPGELFYKIFCFPFLFFFLIVNFASGASITPVRLIMENFYPNYQSQYSRTRDIFFNSIPSSSFPKPVANFTHNATATD